MPVRLRPRVPGPSCRFGGDGEVSYALPRLDDPLPDVTHIICIQGGAPEAAPGRAA